MTEKLKRSKNRGRLLIFYRGRRCCLSSWKVVSQSRFRYIVERPPVDPESSSDLKGPDKCLFSWSFFFLFFSLFRSVFLVLSDQVKCLFTSSKKSSVFSSLDQTHPNSMDIESIVYYLGRKDPTTTTTRWETAPSFKRIRPGGQC